MYDSTLLYIRYNAHIAVIMIKCDIIFYYAQHMSALSLRNNVHIQLGKRNVDQSCFFIA